MPLDKRVKKQQICLECQRLQAENEALKQQIDRLNQIISELSNDTRQKLESITSSSIKSKSDSTVTDAVSLSYSEQMIDSDTTVLSLRESPLEIITKESSLTQKLTLFKGLFKGREDVYARRFENQKTGKSGYAPSCQNEWKPGVCPKPKIKCQDCSHKSFLAIDDQVIEAHLRGKIVIGLYPLLQDNHCWFLSIDFDEANWQDDVRALRQFCDENDIPVAIERSRSGNGGHVWYFFREPILAAKARKFGSVLITAIMQRRHEVSFKSYDRLFPAQDTLAKDGLGNLIALPLQGQVAQTGNSCFIDSDFNRYPDQWLFLSQVHRLSEIKIDQFITSLSEGTELGVLFDDGSETVSKPWLSKIESSLNASDFPTVLTIALANGIYIQKQGISQRALNRIKRLAAFSNPEFYKKQAMHFSTWDTPRIIACHQEHEQFIQLPRGCQDALEQLLSDAHVHWQIQDERQTGHSINVLFKGSLWPLQQDAADILVKRNTGVLCGTTAFGKTITAIYLIAYHKVNTLILVDRVPLIQQWQSSIMQFLDIQEQMPETGKSRGRKKASHIVGQLGGSRNDLHNVVDIAVFQSLVSGHEIKDLIKNYGLIIVDECHHVAAASFEKVMNEVNSKYVYGLSATPVRQDGKQPIVYMQCGLIVYRDDARKQANERPFAHILSPRFTNYQIPSDWDPSQCQIQDIFSDLTLSISRNNQITKDISETLRSGRNVIVLTDRKDHVERLAKAIQSAYPNVIALTGVGTAKQKREKLDMIKKQSASAPLIIIATGKYVGEGFDEPRLDTLFLVMPFSWKGTLAQYAGRLHRIYTGKNDVQIYDYVDIHVPVLERMYGKRLKGYRDLGYQVGEPGLAPARQNFIYDYSNYWDSLMDDLLAAKEMVWISSTSLNIRTIRSLEKLLEKRDDKLNSQVLFVNNNSQSNKMEKYDYYHRSAEILDRLAFCIRKIDDISCNAVIIDQRILWYGSLAPLGFTNENESMMRIESPKLAMDLQSVLSDMMADKL